VQLMEGAGWLLLGMIGIVGAWRKIMQIRCLNCHKPFALNKDAVHVGLTVLHEKGLSHYDVVCPHCHRVNHVSRDELMRAAPDWTPPKKESPEQK
jgi:phage FluMu protein Com